MFTEVLYMITGLILEGISYGVYCVIFCLYLRIQLKRIGRWKSLLLYAVIVNFILCTAYFALGSTRILLLLKSYLEAGSPSLWFSAGCLNATVDTLYICIDLISQGILIYRCWIMWRRPMIVVIPIILSLGFLATALTAFVFMIKSPGFGTMKMETPKWYRSTVASFFSISLAVNALVTGLIAYKIFNVYRESSKHHHQTAVYTAHGKEPRDLYPIVSMLVESGVITFVGQLLQAILYKFDSIVFPLVSGTVVMLYGISMTIVLVRVQMGLSYDHGNEVSRPTVTWRSLRFAPFESNGQDIHGDPELNPEMKIEARDDVQH